VLRNGALPRWFVVLFLGAQIAVPVVQLTRPRPARFGWQMYAGLSEPLAFTTLGADGSVGQVEIAKYLAFHRGDIAVSKLIPPAVCEREIEVIEVRYRLLPESTDRTFRCVR
jgi:hypothetical protein